LAPNPSHLETVGAVIEGITRAKSIISLMIFQSTPIAVHGDAAVAGQGILYCSNGTIRRIQTGGTIHM
jgi:2-oxoglutarate dehydrogenase E1 component